MAFSQAQKEDQISKWHGALPQKSISNLLDILGGVEFAVITGGAAGNHTVTGIAVGDLIMFVLDFVGAPTAITDVADLTSEFSVTAANTINNTGGTASDKLLVIYRDLT